jgi:pyridoxamine 5'-phosphate oxidase
MTRPPPPATPEEALETAFRLLARGVADRRSPLHTPTLGTVAADGGPSLRTVVLRGFDPAARRIRLHTDRRSAKVAEIAARPRVTLHGYDAGAQVQLRLAGHATLHLDDAEAEGAWAGSRAMARMIYATPHAPGAMLDAPPPAPQDAEGGRGNFAVLTITLDGLDWLLLAHEGHRRARFAWGPAGVLSAAWVAP